MPHIRVYIHFVWSTKNRVPHLNTPELRKKVWQHIIENAKSKGIYVDYVNGYADHCHCLVSLGVDQTIQKVINLIKGESSYWVNKNNLTSERFEWQNDYFAVSVSESNIDRVRDYIKKQEEHHQKKSFQEEYEEFIKYYNFKNIEDGNLGYSPCSINSLISCLENFSYNTPLFGLKPCSFYPLILRLKAEAIHEFENGLFL